VLTGDPDEASRRAAGEARALLEGLSPSFAVLFTSAHFPGSTEALVAAVAEETGPLPLIACGVQAVVRGAREIESGPAVPLWLAAGPPGGARPG
jgi:small ligand-binding sensory domain FIST